MSSHSLRQIGAIARRDLLIEASYQFRLLLRYWALFGTVLILYYASELVDDPEELAGFDGDYFDYVIIGFAVATFADLGLAAFAGRIAEEQTQGTLEALLMTPARSATILLGGFVVPIVFVLVEVVVLIGVGVGVAGAGLPGRGVLLSIPLLLLMAASFCAIGIAAAGFIILAKRGDPVSGPIYQVTLLLSGALFPVELFPPFVRWLSYAVPAFYGIRGVREALLGGAGFAGVVDEMLISVGFCVVLLPLSLRFFRWTVDQARRAGTLGNY